MSIKLETEDLEHLKIRCTTTLCNRDLHCFLRKRKVDQKSGGGPCRKCQKDPVDWSRVSRRDLKDVEYTISMLQLETIRRKFWVKPIAPALLDKARAAGRRELRGQVRHILAQKVAPKPKGTPWDSRQTPYEGNVIYFGQHATACCCRRCAQEWHGIPEDRTLTKAELDYMVELVMQYIERRVPELPESGDANSGAAA